MKTTFVIRKIKLIKVSFSIQIFVSKWFALTLVTEIGHKLDEKLFVFVPSSIADDASKHFIVILLIVLTIYSIEFNSISLLLSKVKHKNMTKQEQQNDC